MAVRADRLTGPPVRPWFVACLATLAAQGGAGGADAAASVRSIGIQRGICVVLGLPDADHPRFVADLARATELLVYFQSPDPDEVKKVRECAEAEGLLGQRVFVDRGDWNSISLADNLAGAVLVGPAAEKSVTRAELLRVLHPEGKASLNGSEIVKPFPQGCDDWKYPYHGPDNNPQSLDRRARAPYLTQFIAEPKFCPSPAVTVAADGRIYRVCGHLAHQANQNAMLNTLLAMNAYNGTILWKRPLKAGFMVLRNTIIATAEILYLADDESCKLLDAATGRLKDEIVVSEEEGGGTVWKWMALEKGILYALIGGKEVQAPVLRAGSFGLGGWPRANWPGFDYADPATAWGQGRTIVAIDAETKKIIWRYRGEELIDGRAVCMRGGRIYFLSPERLLGCLDDATGQLVWKTSDADLLKAIGPLFPAQPRWTGLSPFPYVKCNDSFLFFSGPRIPRVVAVSTKDGRLAWQRQVPLTDAGSVHVLLREDAIWAMVEGGGDDSFRMAYDTGEVLSRFLGRRGCTMATGSADSIFYRAAEGTVRIDTATSRAEHIAPMRPPCYDGVIISGGLLYWGAWKCRCPLSLYGTICLAPAGGFNDRPGLDGSRLEPGPADPMTVDKIGSHSGDWPCYQGDNERTCATKVAIGKRVSRPWVFEPPWPVMPTAPIVAGGMVFLGDHSGLVRALDASDGALRWQAYTGGAIFFPPAVREGRLYFGSADGHVYALEAKTGRLLWRFRAAPSPRRIPVYGKLMSTWPVAGGVLVEDGVVYAAAGIAHYDGTHVYALDALTGKVKWYNGDSGKLSPKTGSGISLQGELYLRAGQLCFLGGNAYLSATYDLETGRCTSAPHDRAGSAYRTAFYPYYPEYGRYTSLNHTLADGRTLNYAADYSGAQHSTLALFAPPPPGADKPPSDWRITDWSAGAGAKPSIEWEHKSPARYNSFIVAPDVFLAAGETGSDDRSRAFLAAFKMGDGSQLWREDLPVPAVKGGAAIDHKGRIFVSLEDGRIFCFAPAEYE